MRIGAADEHVLVKYIYIRMHTSNVKETLLVQSDRELSFSNAFKPTPPPSAAVSLSLPFLAIDRGLRRIGAIGDDRLAE